MIFFKGLPWWLRQYRACLQCRRPGFHPWVWKIPWRREWLPTPVSLLGASGHSPHKLHLPPALCGLGDVCQGQEAGGCCLSRSGSRAAREGGGWGAQQVGESGPVRREPSGRSGGSRMGSHRYEDTRGAEGAEGHGEAPEGSRQGDTTCRPGGPGRPRSPWTGRCSWLLLSRPSVSATRARVLSRSVGPNSETPWTAGSAGQSDSGCLGWGALAGRALGGFSRMTETPYAPWSGSYTGCAVAKPHEAGRRRSA